MCRGGLRFSRAESADAKVIVKVLQARGALRTDQTGIVLCRPVLVDNHSCFDEPPSICPVRTTPRHSE